MLSHCLSTLTTSITQRSLFELGQQARELQHVLLDASTHVGDNACIAYNLNALVALNKLRLLLQPLASDYGVSTRDRHAAGVHAAAILRLIEDGEDYRPNLLRLQATYRYYYATPAARR